MIRYIPISFQDLVRNMRKVAKLFSWQFSFLVLAIVWLPKSLSAPGTVSGKDNTTTFNIGTTESSAEGISILYEILYNQIE